LTKDSKLKLTAGVAAYHEFADPYRVKVGMTGMDGAFTLRDEKRSDNRGVIRAGFDYSYRDLSLYGSLISYIDREARTSAKTGVKVKF
ncbi:MAG: autotransporter outer membrane beta-barrel domain-containing protein, partial [Alphaproteobacteria bacterium]|nr:autotransporter outer membrane beta-barrel domain-containing protein [Alphaproteobacteria bacterium]